MSARGCLGLLEQCFCFGQCGLVAYRGEQFACLGEWLFSSGITESTETAALAEESVGVFGLVPELVPALGGLGVEGCGLAVVGGGLCE